MTPIHSSYNGLHYIHLDETKQDELVWRQGSGLTFEILDLVVGNQHRREGRGTILINSVKEKLLSLGITNYTLWVMARATNAIAAEFYMAIGFKVLAQLPSFYPPHTEPKDPDSDAVLYALVVLPESSKG